MKKILQMMIIATTLLAAKSALAVDPVSTGYFSNKAVKGYDTVAYFTENKAVKGSSDFVTEYNGADWYFSSQANLDLFVANPEKYAPQYGGYCAWAVSQNKTAPIKPELFTIVDGKLYLNFNEKINDQWNGNRDEFINLADQHWPNLVDK